MPTLILLLVLLTIQRSTPLRIGTNQEDSATAAAVRLARSAIARARAFATVAQEEKGAAWADCVRLYEESDCRLRRLTAAAGDKEYDESLDALTWLSAAVTSHETCLEGLREQNASLGRIERRVQASLRRALALHAVVARSSGDELKNYQIDETRFLETWNAYNDKADLVVAQDGSGDYSTISGAIIALGNWWHKADARRVIYVKSGVYAENVNIDINTRNIMLVGDGIGQTVVTGRRSVTGGFTTFSSATFSVSGDGFWARDMSFENTAGPEKHQAVALVSASDRSVFYRCSFKGYQDTLFAHSQRQFYRDCDIYGTIDFIFGNAAVILQNCNIYVRRPMTHQANMITAQGRDDVNQNTGITVQGSRVLPAGDFQGVKSSFETYLGRPWKKYSRTVFMKTEMDGMIQPEGWARWSGNYALDTLYYGEYMNTGEGARTGRRVRWPGFHVLDDAGELQPFTVNRFLQGQSWIPESGVPFWLGL